MPRTNDLDLEGESGLIAAILYDLPEAGSLQIGSEYVVSDTTTIDKSKYLHNKIEYTLTKLTKIKIGVDEITVTPLPVGSRFQMVGVSGITQDWEVGANGLVLIAGGDVFVPNVVAATGLLVPSKLAEGKSYLLSGINNIANPKWTIVSNIAGQKQYTPLQAGAIYADADKHPWRFDGLRVIQTAYPIYVPIIATKNIPFADIVAKSKIDAKAGASILAACLDTVDGKQFSVEQGFSATWPLAVLATAQTDTRQNYIWIFLFDYTTNEIQYSPLFPTERGKFIQENVSLIVVTGGDNQGTYAPQFTLLGVLLYPGLRVGIVGTSRTRWVKRTPNLADLKALGDRTTALEGSKTTGDTDIASLKAAVTSLTARIVELEKEKTIESFLPPDRDREDYRRWRRHNWSEDWTEDWFELYERTDYEIVGHYTRTKPYTMSTHDTTTVLANGDRRTDLPFGIGFTYTPNQGVAANELTFPAGLLLSAGWEAKDAAGVVVASNAANIAPDATVNAFSVFVYDPNGVLPLPVTAVKVDVVIAFREGRSPLRYSYPVV